MRFKIQSYRLILGALSVLLIVFLINSCGKKLVNEGKIIFTQFPVQTSLTADHLNSIESKYAPSMKIVMAKIAKGLQNIEVLTSEFNSARAPEVSYDGLTLVFSAQKNEGDPWQIWTMKLETKEFVKVTESRTNCTDPTWLPNGDIAFSKLVTDEKSLKYHALFTIGPDGCCEQRITFQPHEDVNASVLHDGRILVASRQVFPGKSSFKYLALRPDGTKAEVFHRADVSSEYMGKAKENGDGRVLFAEFNELTSVNFTRPLHSRSIVINKDQGMINSIYPIDESSMLVTIKKPVEHTYGIAILDINNSGQEDFYFNDSKFHALDVVVVEERIIPRKLPTRVNHDMTSGYFISMNADASDIEVEGNTTKVQVFGMNTIIGESAVETDGSFYLELAADRPIRFQTIDENGKILRGPSSWMWVRPNERRGCVGCHQNREIAPNNIVPKAIEKAPIAMIR